MWRDTDPQGNEAAKVKFDIVRYTRGIVLDFGCGPNKAFPHFLGVDSGKDTEMFGIAMKPDLVLDCTDPAVIAHNFNAESVDAIFSSHLLEHVKDYHATLMAWWSLIKEGGHLVLYLPDEMLYPNIGTLGANPDHKHDFSRADIMSAMSEIAPSWECVVDQQRNVGTEYSFLQVYRKTDTGTQVVTAHIERQGKSAMVVRHGGIGDQMQAAFLLPELKRQGYHITFLTTPTCKEPIAHDPHIDEWYIVDKDQVPNHELGPFWKNLSRHYDKFINLNESVEGVFLALPGRIQHTWPQPLRHKLMNHNYAEHAAAVAEVPFVPEGFFVPTSKEGAAAWAKISEWEKEMGNAGDTYFIMFALAGSSPHKFNPHQDEVIEQIINRLSRAIVVTVGDIACKILEAGLDHPRIKCLAGELSTRDTLTLTRLMHLVIGPETGVMNAVAYEEDIAKVVMLSHSSAENLTKHWKNTVSLAGVAPCYPCHQLHYDAEYCPRDPEHHAAICQANMDYRTIYAPIDADYTAWAKMKMFKQSIAA